MARLDNLLANTVAVLTRPAVRAVTPLSAVVDKVWLNDAVCAVAPFIMVVNLLATVGSMLGLLANFWVNALAAVDTVLAADIAWLAAAPATLLSAFAWAGSACKLDVNFAMGVAVAAVSAGGSGGTAPLLRSNISNLVLLLSGICNAYNPSSLAVIFQLPMMISSATTVLVMWVFSLGSGLVINIRMTNYYNPALWQGRIRAGITVVDTLNEENYYALPQLGTICFPWGIDTNQQVLITGMHQSFWQRQQWSVRAWASAEPGGISLTQQPYPSENVVSLNGAPSTWLFYPDGYTPVARAAVKRSVPVGTCLWFNLENVCNEDNRVFCKMEYQSL